MPNNTRPIRASISTRVARARKAAERHRIVRFLGGRGAAALLLGTALSIGGFTETMQGVHFLVQKDLDSVRIVRLHGDDETVVANLGGGFTANTLFKLSQALPDRYVSRELAMFDQKWIAADPWAEGERVPSKARDVFFEEVHRINK